MITVKISEWFHFLYNPLRCFSGFPIFVEAQKTPAIHQRKGCPTYTVTCAKGVTTTPLSFDFLILSPTLGELEDIGFA